jgi:hypothetical protein
MTSSGNSRQEKPCTTDQHHEHLCQLAEQYCHVHEPERFRAIVLDPRFKCEYCGRAAAEARNLCYPAPL